MLVSDSDRPFRRCRKLCPSSILVREYRDPIQYGYTFLVRQLYPLGNMVQNRSQIKWS